MLSNHYYTLDENGGSGASIRFLRAAALQDYAPAQLVLGRCYQHNEIMAACLYTLAAELGLGSAQYELAASDFSSVMLTDV